MSDLSDRPARLTAADFDPAVLKLFDQYVHGLIDRRGFLDQAGRYAAIAGTTSVALLAALSPDFAGAQQVAPGDAVKKGQVVCVVDTVKAAIDVECWDDGVVHVLLAEPGTRLPGHPVFIDWLPDREHGSYIGAGAQPGAQVVAFRASRTRPLVVVVGSVHVDLIATALTLHPELEVTLVGQPWVRDDKQTIGDLVASTAKAAGQATPVAGE